MEKLKVSALTVKKKFTVALAALDDYSIVEQVHLCLEAQTIRQSLEIIFICKSKEILNLPSGFSQTYSDVIVIEGGEEILLNEAREVGVRNASTPYVLLLEDHCLPFPTCLEKMLARLEEGWSAVGPSFVSGNTVSEIAIAANILTYGQWMGQKQSEEMSFVSGYNSAFPVHILLARGGKLTEDLVAPSTLQMSLAKEGHKFYLENEAVMAHWESSNFYGVREILGKNGYGLGTLRARNWSILYKIFFSILSPVLMGYRLLRASGVYCRLKQSSPKILFYLIPLTFMWTIGELRGYWTSGRHAIEGVSDVERNRQRYVNDQLEPIKKPFL